MPSTTSSVVSMALASSTVMTPSFPTFFMASAMMLPIVESLFAELMATCALLGDGRRSEFLIENDIPSLRTKRNLHRVRQRVHTTQDRLPRVFAMNDLFSHSPSLFLAGSFAGSCENSENFIFAENQVLVVV